MSYMCLLVHMWGLLYKSIAELKGMHIWHLLNIAKLLFKVIVPIYSPTSNLWEFLFIYSTAL